MGADFDRTKSLEELEGDVWGEPEFKSGLVTTCHALRRKPLCEFTPENLRIMIGQSIGLHFLAPLALEVLAQNPLIETDFAPGVLLKYVLEVDPVFWQERKDLWWRACEVVEDIKELKKRLDEDILPMATKFEQLNSEGQTS
jgi:hypothetical protein